MKKEELKILFIGADRYSLIVLEKLIVDNFTVAGVLVPELIGRDQKLKASCYHLYDFAKRKGLKILEFKKMSHNFWEDLRRLDTNIAVLTSFGKILPADFISLFKFGVVNVHPSLLPKYRGPSPVQEAIINGDKVSGVTIIQLNNNLDSGDIIYQKEVKIGSKETQQELSKKLFRIGADILSKILIPYCEGRIKLKKQDEKLACHTKIIKREDGLIDFNQDAQEIYNKWRAYYPWPGIFFYINLNGCQKRVKIIEIEKLVKRKESSNTLKPGLNVLHGKLVLVAKKGVLFLKKVQIEGKKVISSDSFLQGYSRMLKN